MVAQLVGAMGVPEVAMPVHVESRLERSAQLVGSAAVVEDPVRVPCHTWELARESISKKQLTNISALSCVRHLPALGSCRPSFYGRFGTGLHGMVAVLAHAPSSGVGLVMCP